MAELNIKVECRADGLLSRINALAEHVNAAPIGDPIAELAAEIGEIDPSTDIIVSTEFVEGRVFVNLEATGNLARILSAFEAKAGAAQ